MNFDNIPREMRELNQWTCYRTYSDNKGKIKKVIISPVTSEFASCNDPNTWTNFETAKKYCLNRGYQGLTFALTEGITCIDIDHALDKNKGTIISNDAIKLMLIFANTYIEKSVSGTGVHIFMKGSLPPNARNRNDKSGLEMYDRNRFICMTGNTFTNVNILHDYSKDIGLINRNFIGAPVEISSVRCVNSDWSPSDSDLIDKIRSSKIGSVFDEYYSGGFNGFSDHSSADFAFAKMLCWWTQDINQIDRIFRASGLYRPKWDSKRGETTYGFLTIQKAMQSLNDRHSPPEVRKKIKYSTAAEM